MVTFSNDTLVEELQVASGLTKLTRFLNSLPPLVAAVVWDVVNGRITKETVAVANATTEDDFARYDVIRCVAAANPKYAPITEAQACVDHMLEELL